MAKKKNPHAVALGRLGAAKGAKKAGKARWENVSATERTEHAKNAARARWSRRKEA